MMLTQSTDAESPPPSSPSRPVSDLHLQALRASGLTDETICDAGLYSAKGRQIADILGWQPSGFNWGDALVFPFRTPDGSETGYARVKPDYPRHAADGKAVKYESPRKEQNHTYFPPRFSEMFATSTTILITEGEKKTLAAMQAGFCCAGLVGVWGFQKRRLRDDRGKVFGKRQLIPDLANLSWSGKRVIVVFDSDVDGRPELQLAEYRMAELLDELGADVRVARLPQVTTDKTGLDDFLVHHGAGGPAMLQTLIGTAAEPELPECDGPMDFAKILISESFEGDTGLRMRYWREDFWRFTGRCYQLVSESELVHRTLRWLDERGFNATPRLAADIGKCVAAISLVGFDRDMPTWLDGESHGEGWVSFQNGLYRIGDPARIQAMPHTARYFSPWSLDYEFDPGANCPVWLAFLKDVFDGDAERIDLLQRWMGLLLVAETSFQKLLLFIGPPRAGKGTVCRVITQLIGPANCASPTLTSLATRFGLASLQSKPVAILADAHMGRHADGIRVAEVLKSIVGEDPQDIDRKYREPLTSVRLPTRFVISCNELAHFTDPSGALAARLSVIPFFNSYVGREDRTLEQRLRAELPGIASWAIVGLARLRAEGRLNVPDKAQPIHDNFKRLSSPTAAFIEECVELHPTFSESTTDVFAAWVGWCKVHGHESGSDARMGERLRAVNATIERTRPRQNDGSRPYRYQGLRLTSDGWDHEATGRDIQSRGKNRGGE